MAVRSLLTIANPKTTKGEKQGYRTAVVHLSPADLSGRNVCASSTAGCRAACLNTAGRGRFDSVQAARRARTDLFFEDRSAFVEQLLHEIELFVRASKRAGFVPAVRLNGTSDIRWEVIPAGDAPNVFSVFSDVQFYDYTKHANRRGIPRNYHLTFSLAEGPRSWKSHLLALDRGFNVAVVLSGAGDSRFPRPFPKMWNGRRLIDGERTDLRFMDRPKRGAYVGLRAKGDAKRDRSGFVFNVHALPLGVIAA